MTLFESTVRPVLFRLGGGDAEKAHEFTLRRLSRLSSATRSLMRSRYATDSPIDLFGVRFPNRVGLAAGMDKNGVALPTWPAMGFGFVEVGTVTAHAQPGNEKPRVFRLRASDAIINRMGFNNEGAAALAERLEALSGKASPSDVKSRPKTATRSPGESRRRPADAIGVPGENSAPPVDAIGVPPSQNPGGATGVWRGDSPRPADVLGVPLGVSLGKSKVTPLDAAVEDYLTSYRLLAKYADYIAVNVSSPNTPGLRSLQDKSSISDLLRALRGDVPVLVKIAPDLSEPAIAELLEVCMAEGAAGVIATNTTLGRDGLAAADQPRATEAGGLSGHPLTEKARKIVHFVHAETDGRLPIIGVGGVMCADDASRLFDAGASLIQLYSGFIYHGPALVRAAARTAPPDLR